MKTTVMNLELDSDKLNYIVFWTNDRNIEPKAEMVIKITPDEFNSLMVIDFSIAFEGTTAMWHTYPEPEKFLWDRIKKTVKTAKKKGWNITVLNTDEPKDWPELQPVFLETSHIRHWHLYRKTQFAHQ